MFHSSHKDIFANSKVGRAEANSTACSSSFRLIEPSILSPLFENTKCQSAHCHKRIMLFLMSNRCSPFSFEFFFFSPFFISFRRRWRIMHSHCKICINVYSTRGVRFKSQKAKHSITERTRCVYVLHKSRTLTTTQEVYRRKMLLLLLPFLHPPYCCCNNSDKEGIGCNKQPLLFPSQPFTVYSSCFKFSAWRMKKCHANRFFLRKFLFLSSTHVGSPYWKTGNDLFLSLPDLKEGGNQ